MTRKTVRARRVAFVDRLWGAQRRATQKRPVGAEAHLAGAPAKPPFGFVGRGGTVERVRPAACGGARDAELVPTRWGKHRVRLYAARTRRGAAPAPPAP